MARETQRVVGPVERARGSRENTDTAQVDQRALALGTMPLTKGALAQITNYYFRINGKR
jgi:hypothetical protein